MPKVTVTLTYDSLEDAFAELMPQQSRIEIRIPDDSLGANVRPDVQPEKSTRDVLVDDLVATKKPRKPRADAGVPRGPYKKGDEEPAAPQAGNGVGSVSAAAVTDGAEGGKNSPAPVAEQSVKEWTIDAIKAEMSVLSKKKGIDANIQLLAKFGVQKVSALPVTKYNEFVAAVRAAAAA